MIRFCCVVNRPDYFQQLEALLRQQGECEIASLTGAKGICQPYNEMARGSSAEILGFLHQDARLEFDWARLVPQYFAELDNPGVLGFIGAKKVPLSGWWWEGGGLHGSVHVFEGRNSKIVMRPCTQETKSGLKYEPVQGVDAYALFIQRSTFEAIGGFSEYLDGWHFYDMDLCLKAEQAGFKNYVIDQPTWHIQGTSIQQPFENLRANFQTHWRAYLAKRR